MAPKAKGAAAKPASLASIARKRARLSETLGDVRRQEMEQESKSQSERDLCEIIDLLVACPAKISGCLRDCRTDHYLAGTIDRSKEPLHASLTLMYRVPTYVQKEYLTKVFGELRFKECAKECPKFVEKLFLRSLLASGDDYIPEHDDKKTLVDEFVRRHRAMGCPMKGDDCLDFDSPPQKGGVGLFDIQKKDGEAVLVFLPGKMATPFPKHLSADGDWVFSQNWDWRKAIFMIRNDKESKHNARNKFIDEVEKQLLEYMKWDVPNRGPQVEAAAAAAAAPAPVQVIEPPSSPPKATAMCTSPGVKKKLEALKKSLRPA